MKWLKILCIILLLGCTDSESKEPKVFNLPDAVLNTPYSLRLEFEDQPLYQRTFYMKISPENTGLSITITNWRYNEIIISGTPKKKQDIYININYTKRGPRRWGESLRKSKQFKIEVKE